jgi:hypothetical protein
MVILTTSCWAGRQSSEVVRGAADVLCRGLSGDHAVYGFSPIDDDHRNGSREPTS